MIKRFLVDTKWGAKSLISLYISVLSGVVLSLQYDFPHPFYSAVSLDLLIPYGVFWRSLHFYSSQLFFLFSLVHLVAVLVGSSQQLTLKKWMWLSATLPLSLLLLFTGYVLRGDSTGESAGHIAENICISIPIIGNMLNSLLFSISGDGMKRVYANHVIGLGVFWGIFAWDHLRRYRVNVMRHGWLIFCVLLIPVIWDAPMEIMKGGVFYISGPWFFLGLQELLRYMPVFWAGVFIHMLLLVAVAFMQEKEHVGRRAQIFVICWLLVYSVATFVALSRVG